MRSGNVQASSGDSEEHERGSRGSKGEEKKQRRASASDKRESDQRSEKNTSRQRGDQQRARPCTRRVGVEYDDGARRGSRAEWDVVGDEQGPLEGRGRRARQVRRKSEATTDDCAAEFRFLLLLFAGSSALHSDTRAGKKVLIEVRENYTFYPLRRGQATAGRARRRLCAEPPPSGRLRSHPYRHCPLSLQAILIVMQTPQLRPVCRVREGICSRAISASP